MDSNTLAMFSGYPLLAPSTSASAPCCGHLRRMLSFMGAFQLGLETTWQGQATLFTERNLLPMLPGHFPAYISCALSSS
jgi:hypothetical protein